MNTTELVLSLAREITADEFASRTPYQRGYTVCLMGAREDQPNVPNEGNPFPIDSHDHKEWERGRAAATLITEDDS